MSVAEQRLAELAAWAERKRDWYAERIATGKGDDHANLLLFDAYRDAAGHIRVAVDYPDIPIP